MSKFHYDRDIDSLYIDLVERPAVDSMEVAEHVVLDLDAEGRVVGIDIQHASQLVDLTRVETEALPLPGGPQGR